MTAGPRLRTTTRAIGTALWGVSVGALRDFVWADLRDNSLSLRGLPRGTRSLVWLGFGLLLVVFGLLLVSDAQRARVPLAALPNAVAGRGSLVPIALVPATLFLISMAWTFALTGVLHAHPGLRVATVLMYMAMAIGWLNQASVGGLTELVVSWGAILVVPVVFALRWRAPARPIPEFVVLLLLTSGAFVSLQAQGAESWRVTGVALLLGHINNEMLWLSILITPLLMAAGMGIADFTRQAAGWTVEALTSVLPRGLVPVLLAVVFVWRGWEVIAEALERASTSSVEATLVAYLGALVVVLVVGAAWLAVRWAGAGSQADPIGRDLARRPDLPLPPGGSRPLARAARPVTPGGVAQAADRGALGLILVYVVPQAIVFLLVLVSQPLDVLQVVTSDEIRAYLGLAAGVLNSEPVILGWRLLVATGAAVLAVVLAGRGRQNVALYLGVFGATACFSELARPGRPLGMLAPFGGGSVALVDFWWVLLFGVRGIIWLARGTLTDERVGRLLMLLAITWLLRQTDFISNRFSPFFDSGGVGFLVFGLAWDALTIGAWANLATPGLPRLTRILLYLGYALLTVTVVNWAVSVHDLAAVSRLTEDAALDGLQIYGRPMLYAVFALVLAAPARTAQPGEAASRT